MTPEAPVVERKFHPHRLLALLFLTLFSSCSGSDTQEQVEETTRKVPAAKVTFWNAKQRAQVDRVQEWCWQSLTKRPPKVDEDIVFVGAPWFELLDRYMRTRDERMATNIFGNKRFKNGAAMLEHDIFKKAYPLFKKLGITRIFTPSAKGPRCGDIQIIPVLFKPFVKACPAAEKDLLYSFMGSSNNNPTRKRIVQMKAPADVLIKDRRVFFYNINKQQRNRYRAEYRDALSRSRFALCPMGATPITFRLSEAIWAGAIPVVIAHQLMLPPGIDWKKCLIHLTPKEATNIDKILRAIPQEKEEAMRIACIELMHTLEEDPAYFVRAYFDSQQNRAMQES